MTKRERLATTRDNLVLETAGEDQHFVVFGIEEFEASPAEGLIVLAQEDEPLHPPQEGAGILLLRFYVDGLVMMFRIDDDREIEPLWVGPGKARVAVGAPLHGRAHAVAIAEINIIAHADFVAVIDHRRSRKRKEQTVEQLHLAPVVA